MIEYGADAGAVEGILKAGGVHRLSPFLCKMAIYHY